MFWCYYIFLMRVFKMKKIDLVQGQKTVAVRHPEEASAIGFIMGGSLLLALVAVYFSINLILLTVSFLIFLYGLFRARNLGNRINQELLEEQK